MSSGDGVSGGGLRHKRRVANLSDDGLDCYHLMVCQEEGYDTVDANRQLGFDDDCREYSSVRNILQDLGISSIKLMVRLLSGCLAVRMAEHSLTSVQQYGSCKDHVTFGL